LYVGISQYKPDETKRAADILKNLGTPCLIHQPVYNMLNRWIEDGLTDVLKNEGIGCIVFSPLAQGLLTNKYLHGIPPDSRAGKPGTYFKPEYITEDKLSKVKKLNEMAGKRNQSLAQMAIAWVLHNPVVTSALIGASKTEQIDNSVNALLNLSFTNEELKEIDRIIGL